MNNAPRKTVIAALLLATLGLGASAQPEVAPLAPPVLSHQGSVRDDASLEQHRQHRQQRMAERLARFKQTLNLSAGQEAAWTAWVDAMKLRRRAERPNFVEFARMTTPQRIDAMRSLRALRAAEMDRRGDATKAFYAVLQGDQKKAFDEHGLQFLGGRAGKRGHGDHHGRG